jgi:hypothetical protein
MLAMMKGTSGFSPASSDAVFTMPTKEIEAPEEEEDINKEEQAN